MTVTGRMRLCPAGAKVWGGQPLPPAASHALAVDKPTTILQLPAPQVHVVRREQRMTDICEEQLQEVLA
eukprot:CAMPEP_0175666570 /NCGR_PEP_ID=MMETSP0097-20121207/17653_1 /TAXON_ID=311494 /ORGANISM="Alexandrium monilatum, Strain CCMP3105" /LENGTH=68 /DNA_ID=CAMNT_0016972999 /DNA_START=77 /DNA_END=284 /DNA_ORIENTATION=+